MNENYLSLRSEESDNGDVGEIELFSPSQTTWTNFQLLGILYSNNGLNGGTRRFGQLTAV